MIKIHETAMVTSAFRAMDETLSKDQYAHLWSSARIQAHADRYSNAVSVFEPHAHCLRNRYFFDQLTDLASDGKIDMLINFGCGFSMYPFALPASIKHIEIDLPEVVAYKQQQIRSWQQLGKLPGRNIQYLSCNFNREYTREFRNTIKMHIGKASTFFLLEGVLFFISRKDSFRLFNLFSDLQRQGDYLGSVSFRPQLEQSRVFGKLVSFVEGNLKKNQQFKYQTVEDEFYEKLSGYQLKDHQDTLGLNSKYSPEKVLPEQEVLIEHMYILEKNKN